VVLLSPFALGDPDAATLDLAAGLKALARQKDVPTSTSRGSCERRMSAGTGVHPIEAGHRALAARIHPWLITIVQRGR
jgi:hypothetical protein